MDLRYCMYECDEPGHPERVMQKLGITYSDAIPQSMGNQWWFMDCENMQHPLPKYLTAMVIPDSYRKK